MISTILIIVIVVIVLLVVSGLLYCCYFCGEKSRPVQYEEPREQLGDRIPLEDISNQTRIHEEQERREEPQYSRGFRAAIRKHIDPNCRDGRSAIEFSRRRNNNANDSTEMNTVFRARPTDFTRTWDGNTQVTVKNFLSSTNHLPKVMRSCTAVPYWKVRTRDWTVS